MTAAATVVYKVTPDYNYTSTIQYRNVKSGSQLRQLGQVGAWTGNQVWWSWLVMVMVVSLYGSGDGTSNVPPKPRRYVPSIDWAMLGCLSVRVSEW